MNIVVCTPEWADRLLAFMIEQYPTRSKEYLVWWLRQMFDTGGYKRSLLAVENGVIYGCTTAVYTRLNASGEEKVAYWECNTIVDKATRGKGIGRLLYQAMNEFSDRFSVGFTEAAWRIQPLLIHNFKKIKPVRVYVSVGFYALASMLNFFSQRRKVLKVPSLISFRGYLFEKVNTIADLEHISQCGYWQDDSIEFVRDLDFLKRRFVDIYREYTIYKGIEDGQLFGYFVMRRTAVRGVDMLSLVDYRLTDLRLFKRISKAMAHIAESNKIGMFITLTSQELPFISFSPFTVRLSKKLFAATSLPDINSDSKILITSADSDLDFVYYK